MTATRTPRRRISSLGRRWSPWCRRYLAMAPLLCALLLVVAGPTASALPPTVTVTDHGTVGGSFSTAVAINADGQVVGNSNTAGGQSHAFSWTEAGGMVDLGTLGGNYSEGNAVNAKGYVVGESSTADDAEFHATLWKTRGH